MTTPTTLHQVFPSEPGKPGRDDRVPGVHLLDVDSDGEAKTTVELIDRRYWRVVDWELYDMLRPGLMWVERSSFTVGVDTVETLARLQALELAEPPAEQGALAFAAETLPETAP